MPVISVRIPQMGEGLQEALLVEFIKQPGDQIKRDEPIYVMETDKATTDVESPYDGTLVEWTAEPGTVLEIGSEVGKMEVAEGVKEMPAGHGPSAGDISNEPTSSDGQKVSSGAVRGDVVIPPRTKKYLKEKGLLDQANEIPVAGTKMMPEDVDRFLASAKENTAVPLEESNETTSFQPESTDEYSDTQLAKTQVTLNYRLVRGVASCVPVTVMQTVSWESIAAARAKAKEELGDEAPSGFSMMLSCVVDALKEFPKLRSSLVGDGRYLRTYHHVNLGIAVGLPGDELLTAVVSKADQLDREQFFAAVKCQVELARAGEDQANAAVPVTISNIGSAGMRWGIPAIVSPGIATLVIGEIFDQPVPDGVGVRFQKTAELTLSFDHRIMNGIGAADFMSDLKKRIESYS